MYKQKGKEICRYLCAMDFKKQLFFMCSIVAFPVFLRAQKQPEELQLISNHIQEHDALREQTRSVHLRKSYNPLKSFLYLSLFFYQQIVSEQVSAECEFERSCSNYSIEAIKEFGLIKGVCLTADRLTRCNGQAQSETQSYLINHSKGKAIDEPSMYHFKD